MKQNNTTYNNLFLKIKENFQNREITKDDISLIKSLLNKKVLISIIKEIIHDEYLLNKIANRSYTHALGFDKIVLIDLSKDCESVNNKVQLRFHIWDNKNNGLSVLEAMHEHSFNFISTVLTGKLENQCFEMNEINDLEKELIEILKNIVKTESNKTIEFINEQIEILESKKLKELGSVMFDKQKLDKKINLEHMKEYLNIDLPKLNRLTAIQGHYVSNRISGERNSYKHILESYKSVTPVEVMSISEGEYYFHPYQWPHRLYYDKSILNSTLLLTTPIKSNPQGGSLQRITYQKANEKEYTKIKLDSKTLKEKLINYLKEVE